MHQLGAALAAAGLDEVTLFSASWRDRLHGGPDGTRCVDRAIPVRLLNLAWHRLGWPPIERLAPGPFDVVHAPHPLLLPARRAAQVVTVHDLSFLDHPEWTAQEIRRDYPALVRAHARRADAVVTVSRHVARQVVDRLEVPADRVAVCPHGAPAWEPRGHVPSDGVILFVGTLEPRENVGTLLGAYARLLARQPGAPPLVLAGSPTPAAAPWLAAIGAPPLAGRVRHVGYVEDGQRRSLYEGARLLVLPSWDEGFGLPLLEAMAAGVPAIVSNRGALAEVAGGAAEVIEPADEAALADALVRLLADPARLEALRQRGIARARAFSWDASARAHRAAYEAALERRRARAAERA